MLVHVITNVRTGQPVHVALTGPAAEAWVRDNVGGPWRIEEGDVAIRPIPPHEMPVKVRSR